MNLLIHVEQYNVMGILPSQLESLRLLCDAVAIDKRGFVDLTPDGIPAQEGFTRYGSMADFLAREKPNTEKLTVLDPRAARDIREHVHPPDSWLCFGPSMGWSPRPHGYYYKVLDGYTINSRDCVPYVLARIL